MGGVTIMITPQQQKNREAIERAKQKVIKYLTENEHIVFFFLGLSILVMVVALAVSVS